jgi:sugar/nucleoside kinase (ribokinase family)
MSDLINTKPKLLVIGDALRDIYMQGQWGLRNGALRFKPHEILELEGGAANTLANARAILGNKAIVEKYMNPVPLSLYRFIEKQEVRESYVQPISHNVLSLPWEKHCPDGLIISDYNKGTVNRPPNCSISQADWIIVDSRYRSVHPEWLALGAIKIWRCTGEEWDPLWSRHFDYIVHTDGPNTIELIASDGHFKRIKVPEIQVVDTCGAGDTFTAMLGSYLLLNLKNYPVRLGDFYPLADAIPHCVKAAQEVCMKQYTAITSEKL